MKTHIFLIFGFLALTGFLVAQDNHIGMHYQAIARDADGELLANEQLVIKVEMMTIEPNEAIIYSEMHTAESNAFGLINLTIGHGEKTRGSFGEIPWQNQNIWSRISVKKQNDTDFRIVTSSKLYSVPYAYYAAEAGTVSDSESILKNGSPSGGNTWSLKGNKNADNHNDPPVIGTTDYVPVVIVTDDEERIRITEDGEIQLTGNLDVGGSAVIQEDLTVYQDVFLNTQGGSTTIDGPTTIGGPGMNQAIFTGPVQMDKTLNVDGETDLNSALRVNNASSTVLTGTLNVIQDTDLDADLNVDGETDLNSALRVNNAASTVLTGTLNVNQDTDLDADLNVDGETDLNSALRVNNAASTVLTGTLNVNQDTDLDADLNVDGETDLNSALRVNNAASTVLTGTLNVNQDADLDADLNVDGETDLNSALRVNNASSTVLTGTLNVNQFTDLDADLNVDGNSNLGGTLTVANNTNLNNTLTVANATTLNNTLTVANATTLNNTLTVANTATLNGVTNVNNSLNVTRNAPDGQYVATFTNTDNGNGDGIKIKLGKHKTTLAPPALPPLMTPAQQAQIISLLDCNVPIANKPQIVLNIVAEGIQADVQMIGGLAVGIGNLLIDEINGELGLPVNFPGINFPAISTPQIPMPDPIPNIPGAQITGGFPLLYGFELIPSIPNVSLASFGIPDFDFSDLSFLGIPNLCLSDGGSPLNNNNKFIQFTDNADAPMGSIRAVSVTNWAQNYLNPLFLFKLRGALTSTVDKKHAQYHFKAEVSAALKDYATIGVEYSSGNGDYAEWLERADHRESITPGDIVAVVGGKISRDLENAEQVMVVSHNPIVLGNMPPEGRTIFGNNIAFMGQVPVKVMGPIESGDYIVTHGEIPGYGYGKSQDEMTIEDFKYAVGRSWDVDLSEGPKMVNTVVGVHNGDYFKVLQKYEAKFQDLESKLEASNNNFETLEARVNQLSDMLAPSTANK